MPPTVDPRVTHFVAAVRTLGGWKRLCSGQTLCAGIVPPEATNPPVVGIVNGDVWHSHSAAFYVVTPRR